jgi:phosphopantothenoylcysteine decarboxylase/phosphopantothenate--cysteine ligase
MLLADRTLLLGVTGGIAAYKACELARMFIREGARVRCVLTPGAARFVTPLTFSALSGQAALVDEFAAAAADPAQTYAHLDLSRGIDCCVLAPLSANTLAKLAHGIADNLLTSALLACPLPIVAAPAMNSRMWANPAVQDNVALIRRRGIAVVEPAAGELACGDTGAGRLAPLEDIFARTVELATAPRPVAAESGAAGVATGSLSGRRIIVTAGATREYLDPVRFMTNASSGRLGLTLAQVLADAGAEVELIGCGLVPEPALQAQLAGFHRVEDAAGLLAALEERLPAADGLVMLAAVADYTPAAVAETKHKKDGQPWTVELAETPDILATLAGTRRPGQLLVGVSLEDTDWLARGMKKAAAKHVELNIAVELGDTRPFGDSRMHCALVTAEGVVEPPRERDKRTLAGMVARWLAARFAGGEYEPQG